MALMYGGWMWDSEEVVKEFKELDDESRTYRALGLDFNAPWAERKELLKHADALTNRKLALFLKHAKHFSGSLQ